MYKTKIKRGIAFCLCTGMMLVSLAGCGKKNENVKPQINIEPYTKMGYDTTTVQSGDIAPILKLTLTLDQFESKNYSVKQEDLEVSKINVAKGDRVEEGTVMVEFKADEIEKTITDYEKQKEEDEAAIEHYRKLAAIDGEDYSDDIESLKEDMEIADTYIKEQNEKLKEYRIIAEKAGTVTFMNENLEYGYASANTTLVTVASGSSNYTATTDDSYEFNVGDVYQADFQVASYDMKVIKVDAYVDDATGKDMQTILFEPVNTMTGVTEADYLEMTIHKPVIKNVTYVNRNALNKKDDEHYYVFVINKDGYRTAVDVNVIEIVDDNAVIDSELTAGEQVTIN